MKGISTNVQIFANPIPMYIGIGPPSVTVILYSMMISPPPIQLSCRAPSYREFEAIAFEHIASLGIQWVEIRTPAPDQVDARVAELAQHGLKAATLQGRVDLTNDDIAGQLAPQLAAFKAFDCTRMLIATPPLEIPFDVQAQRLRTAAELAAAVGVTLILETHPNLATNAADSLRTLQAVDHPALKINYDPANIYFYNEGRDAIQELEPIAQFVGGVHLKDTNGAYKTWHFLPLGRGVVDFTSLFRVLDAAGYDGPYTMEIEGIEGEDRTERLITSRVAESVGYLRGLGQI